MDTSTSPLEAARLAWAEHPTAANERAFYDAKKIADLAEAKTKLRERKEAEDAERARVKALEAKRKRLDVALATARGLPQAVEEDVKWFTARYLEAVQRIESMYELVNHQRAAVKEAKVLAQDLGADVEIPSEAHDGNLRGLVTRSQGDAARKIKGVNQASRRAVHDVTDYFRPVYE